MDEETPKPVINPSDLGKVVVLCGSFPPMPCGVGDSAYELAHELASMGVDIMIRADGSDEEKALRAVVGLVEARFYEEE